jgi:hypothetical protein
MIASCLEDSAAEAGVLVDNTHIKFLARDLSTTLLQDQDWIGVAQPVLWRFNLRWNVAECFCLALSFEEKQKQGELPSKAEWRRSLLLMVSEDGIPAPVKILAKFDGSPEIPVSKPR